MLRESMRESKSIDPIEVRRPTPSLSETLRAMRTLRARERRVNGRRAAQATAGLTLFSQPGRSAAPANSPVVKET